MSGGKAVWLYRTFQDNPLVTHLSDYIHVHISKTLWMCGLSMIVSQFCFLFFWKSNLTASPWSLQNCDIKLVIGLFFFFKFVLAADEASAMIMTNPQQRLLFLMSKYLFMLVSAAKLCYQIALKQFIVHAVSLD